MYLRTIADGDASGDVKRIYDEERDQRGYVMEATRAWTTRPELLHRWGEFYGLVQGGYSLPMRDWRLITLLAAQRVPSTYCSLVYGNALIVDLGSAEQVLAVQTDYRNAGLSQRDVAMLSFAEQVATNASVIEQENIDQLREHGFDDTQIFDIALCASIRCFISRLYDSVGARPDQPFRDLDEPLRSALVVGRSLERAGEQEMMVTDGND